MGVVTTLGVETNTTDALDAEIPCIILGNRATTCVHEGKKVLPSFKGGHDGVQLGVTE